MVIIFALIQEVSAWDPSVLTGLVSTAPHSFSLGAAALHCSVWAYEPPFLPVYMDGFSFHLNCCYLKAVPIHPQFSSVLPALFPVHLKLTCTKYPQDSFVAIVNLPPSFPVTFSYWSLCQNILDMLTQNDF